MSNDDVLLVGVDDPGPCPFCAQDDCELINMPDPTAHRARLFYVHCKWCEAHGSVSRDPHRAIGTWNYTSRAVKKDRGAA